MTRKYEGENQNGLDETGTVYQANFSPLLSRARSFLFYFGTVIALMLKSFFVPPVALRNETFMKTQKTDCSGQHRQLLKLFPI